MVARLAKVVLLKNVSCFHCFVFTYNLFEKHIEVDFNMRICRFNSPEKTNTELDDDQSK